MRPGRPTAVHQSGDLAELVCSNSLKSDRITNASGVLKEEMRRLGSVVLPTAAACRVPAGEALAVDREAFARAVTAAVETHPHIRLERREAKRVPEDRPVVIATGPLTSPAMAESLGAMTGREFLAFYDAVAPTVTYESLDMTRIYRASRRGVDTSDDSVSPEDGVTGDYLNCPMTREEYEAFYRALVEAEVAPVHNPEELDTPFFEKCLPVEEHARRGPKTLAFGPMRPIGLMDPRLGRRPYAVVQLRQENHEGTLWGLVGFQSRLKWGEQRRVFRMIPGLENAEFVRYGVMHRNTYVMAPVVLALDLQVRRSPGVFLAGQITGVEGYVESAAMGLLAGIHAARMAAGRETIPPLRDTALGSLCHYLVETSPRRFSPMNVNFSIFPDLPVTPRDRMERARLKSARALASIDAYAAVVGTGCVK